MGKITRLQQLRRRGRKLQKRYGGIVFTGMAIMVLLSMGVIMYKASKPDLDPAAYQTLLNTIAKGESSGNYNAYYGAANNVQLRFTDMTVDEVLAWQTQYVASGSKSSAVGKYQIVRPTLQGLVQRLGIAGTDRFDAVLQDRLAVALLERRGVIDFMRQKLSREQFAANLAKEWAALPRVIGDNPGESYYAGDGLNQSRISVDEMLAALDKTRAADG